MSSKIATDTQIRLVEHRPGDRLLQVNLSDGSMIKTEVVADPDALASEDKAILARTVNGTSPDRIFKGSFAEARKVLDALAQDGAVKTRRVNHAFAILASVGLVALGYGVGYGVYEGLGKDRLASAQTTVPNVVPGVTASVYPPSTPPELPATIGSAASPSRPEPAPSPNGATGEALKPVPKPASPPPAIQLPQTAQTAPAPVQAPSQVASANPSPAGRLPSVPAPVVTQGTEVQNGLAARANVAAAAMEAANQTAKRDLEAKGADAMMSESEQLKKVLDQLSNGEKILPEVVAGLPHDIAKALRSAGVVLDPNETALATKAATGREYRIVNLPPAVVDRMRDADGVPTIPPANSWAATGGNVIIPLPGGGEIRTPDDLAAFNLQK